MGFPTNPRSIPGSTASGCSRFWKVLDYDLAATLSSGQAFRWERFGDQWEGVIGENVVQLRSSLGGIEAGAFVSQTDWSWLEKYLQIYVQLDAITDCFPSDEPMQQALNTCKGLRLLRQDLWECLASFILSSTKQIVQIRRIVHRLCDRFGKPLIGGTIPWRSFPSVERIAALNEVDLRACGMGFRAPYLLGSARMICNSELDLNSVLTLDLVSAREELMKLPGVGRKIADCVLLFAGGHDRAFPVDVWILKALQQLYFPRRKKTDRQLRAFSERHFGPHGGFAQQYLFHYMRVHHPTLSKLP